MMQYGHLKKRFVPEGEYIHRDAIVAVMYSYLCKEVFPKLGKPEFKENNPLKHKKLQSELNYQMGNTFCQEYTNNTYAFSPYGRDTPIRSLEDYQYNMCKEFWLSKKGHAIRKHITELVVDNLMYELL